MCGMKIEELDDMGSSRDEEKGEMQIVRVDSKRALVGAVARILFYPTLLYNVLRNKIEAEFRWWDQVDEFLLLGAVPFPKDVPHLKKLGVGGVITLNEPYETLVPSSLYHAHGIDHLVIPTRDYLFAPSFADISRAVQFIHQNSTCGKTTYVHCKAGRGRSTTIVLCYLIEYKHMTAAAALEYVRSQRPRVMLAPSQWKAVQNYSKRRPCSLARSPSWDAVLITKADLEGYQSSGNAGMELAIAPKVPKTNPMISRLSCLFASLKTSGNSVPMTRWLPVSESRAC
ncbi:phosphatidylglycerophosphate phosphatase PTPMT2-like [Arachis stenosperma]|uniref:phosphatidylglycerophosphate phosphatase PTPMT2-like n=1 Tax=Arachis stenosperma TaxID=217475 RepID=UPI0025ACA191|nr:phosphatidylglycerophosphate phosphatase PTPMT2-like [Arachis stenosperma]XP_057750121.1 phosphatidylglycerophosphate phosphatase PTPMT2-like [Arachis stenosperma]XP_057750122.1 phosphatidylglycerophosphate phosphatase PTPMT2-like [Arachis stenosperma]XP_057750123.1 phosphatidylglycerophosphate phosphatase PTPMT2-like [Arachis stenosperma]XP_057750124.1 phosphatidylglycerophosphate phosphatase PTPMT2-like [Arachis stenosperma]XP_057750125.1 phosphatidylglycerophosphate phosphatase PTPMT2-li